MNPNNSKHGTRTSSSKGRTCSNGRTSSDDSKGREVALKDPKENKVREQDSQGNEQKKPVETTKVATSGESTSNLGAVRKDVRYNNQSSSSEERSNPTMIRAENTGPQVATVPPNNYMNPAQIFHNQFNASIVQSYQHSNIDGYQQFYNHNTGFNQANGTVHYEYFQPIQSLNVQPYFQNQNNYIVPSSLQEGPLPYNPYAVNEQVTVIAPVYQQEYTPFGVYEQPVYQQAEQLQQPIYYQYPNNMHQPYIAGAVPIMYLPNQIQANQNFHAYAYAPPQWSQAVNYYNNNQCNIGDAYYQQPYGNNQYQYQFHQVPSYELPENSNFPPLESRNDASALHLESGQFGQILNTSQQYIRTNNSVNVDTRLQEVRQEIKSFILRNTGPSGDSPDTSGRAPTDHIRRRHFQGDNDQQPMSTRPISRGRSNEMQESGRKMLNLHYILDNIKGVQPYFSNHETHLLREASRATIDHVAPQAFETHVPLYARKPGSSYMLPEVEEPEVEEDFVEPIEDYLGIQEFLGLIEKKSDKDEPNEA